MYRVSKLCTSSIFVYHAICKQVSFYLVIELFKDRLWSGECLGYYLVRCLGKFPGNHMFGRNKAMSLIWSLKFIEFHFKHPY